MGLSDEQKVLIALTVGYYYVNYSQKEYYPNRLTPEEIIIKKRNDEYEEQIIEEYLKGISYVGSLDQNSSDKDLTEFIEGIEFEFENFKEIKDNLYEDYPEVEKRLDAYDYLDVFGVNLELEFSNFLLYLEQDYDTYEEQFNILGITELIYLRFMQNMYSYIIKNTENTDKLEAKKYVYSRLETNLNYSTEDYYDRLSGIITEINDEENYSFDQDATETKLENTFS